MKLIGKTMLVCLSVLLVACMAYSATIYVDADNTTGTWNGTPKYPFQYIQEGIDTAIDGDTVLVSDGRYVGYGNRDLDFRGKWITVSSEQGPKVTIIDCERIARGFYFHSGETSESILSGFTIVNSSEQDGYIGAICCIESSPLIEGNIITGNFAGGIYCNIRSAPIIRNNLITENSTASGAGGIYCAGSPALIDNNLLSGNMSAGSGGGITAVVCSPSITNNKIIGNSAEQHGGGINCFRSHATIKNNLISGNVAKGWGGGIFMNYYSHPTIINNTIADNSASGGRGGGIFFGPGYPTDPTTVMNTIVWYNKPDAIYMSTIGWMYVTYSNIQGGWPGEGNISSDPSFIDPPNANYAIDDNSPCIGAGIMTVHVPETDIEGNPRPDPRGSKSDIGAYESSEGIPPWDVNRDGWMDMLDFILVCQDFGKAAGGPSDFETDLNGDGKVDILDIIIVAKHLPR